MGRSSPKYVHKRRQSTIPRLPKNAKIGNPTGVTPSFREAPTQPSMREFKSRARPLKDTLPEMDAVRVEKDFGSGSLRNRQEACAHLKMMIEESDSAALVRLTAIAVKALEDEKDAGIVVALVDCLFSAFERGHPADEAMGRLMDALGGEQRAEARRIVISHFGKETDKPGLVTFLQLLGASTSTDETPAAQPGSCLSNTALPPHKTTYSVGPMDGRYMLKPAHSRTDVLARGQARLPFHIASLSSESIAQRERAMRFIVSYVTNVETAREVLSLLPPQKSTAGEKIRLHCINKIKAEL